MCGRPATGLLTAGTELINAACPTFGFAVSIDGSSKRFRRLFFPKERKIA